MQGKKSAINLEQLTEEIQTMNYWSPLFKVLREELSKQGYWKNLPRGKPDSTYLLRGKK